MATEEEKVSIEVTQDQARLLTDVLEFYIAMHLGRFEEVSALVKSYGIHGKVSDEIINWEDFDRFEDLIRQAKAAVGFDFSDDQWFILDKVVHPKAHEVYKIQRMILAKRTTEVD